MKGGHGYVSMVSPYKRGMLLSTSYVSWILVDLFVSMSVRRIRLGWTLHGF